MACQPRSRSSSAAQSRRLDSGAQVRLELLERRHGGEERDVLWIEPGQDDVGEQRVQS
jgi:hypothetical protein